MSKRIKSAIISIMTRFLNNTRPGSQCHQAIIFIKMQVEKLVLDLSRAFNLKASSSPVAGRVTPRLRRRAGSVVKLLLEVVVFEL